MKTRILITGGMVAVVALGAWLRWAVTPVMAGYRCGREIGRMEGAKERHSARRP